MRTQTHPSKYRDPQIRDGETTRYRLGLAANSEDYTDLAAVVSHAGPETYTLALNVAHEELSVDVTQVFAREAGTIRAVSYQSSARNGDRVVSREEGYFDQTAHIQFGGRVQRYPGDMLPLLGGMLGLRGLDFRKGAQLKYNLWLAFSVYWEMTVKVERRETIQVPAGSVDAWRVKVRPSFAQISVVLDKIVGGLLPDFVLHFDASDPSHRMVRFSFPTGPFPWNPKAVIEALALE